MIRTVLCNTVHFTQAVHHCTITQQGGNSMSRTNCPRLDPAELFSDQDIYEAMKKIPGYLDISVGDFKELYLLAYRHAETRLHNRMRAADAMTREVISIRPETPLAEAAALMASHHITGLPVTEEDRTVVGILSEQDFFRNMGDGRQTSCMALVADSLASGSCPAVTIRRRTAEEIMTAPVITVSESTPLSEVGKLMWEKGISRVPVTDSRQRLLGILTRSDIMHTVPERETP
jgi:CBS domain-containing membrane protein